MDQLDQLEGKNEGCIDSGKRLLVLQLGRWGTGPNFRKLFDSIAVSNVAYQRIKAAFAEENDLFGIWRPSNDGIVCWKIALAIGNI